MNHLIRWTLPCIALFAVHACGASSSTTYGAGKSLGATIQGRAGTKVKGKATFAEVSGGLKITVEVEGAPPGLHAVHLHETGDCSAADFGSAGGHFNPDGVKHGMPAHAEHHPGDFGNITIGADGKGKLELVSDVLTLDTGKYAVKGRAIIVHEKPDDGGQPTGNAGGRIGCGVVE